MLTERQLDAQLRGVAAATEHVLAAVFDERLPADRVLAGYLREHRAIGSHDRRLISETVFAVLRWWGWLRDLAPARGGAEGREREAWFPVLLGALLLDDVAAGEGSLQRVADRCGVSARGVAAIGTAPAGSPERASLLLAALRRPATPTIEQLVPDWAQARTTCPRAWPELIAWLQRRPPLWLRIQAADREAVLRELADAGVAGEPHPALPDAVRIMPGRVNLHNLSVFQQGRVEVQDLASQAVTRVCAAQPGTRWWDACAGGGGKSLALAQAMAGRGTIVASDRRERMLEELRRRARRGGFSNIRAQIWDGSPLRARQATYDGVLVDAPCTCSGTWRRNPDARWIRSEADLAEMATVQGRLLRAAATGVRPGGALIYVTCSLFDAENEAVVESFLTESPGFALEPCPHPLTGAGTPGMPRIWPWDGDCDAMFVARLKRI